MNEDSEGRVEEVKENEGRHRKQRKKVKEKGEGKKKKERKKVKEEREGRK